MASTLNHTVPKLASMAGTSNEDKPLPKDFSHYYSITTAARFPSAMKQYYKYFQIPGIGNLAGGLPNMRFFPFDTLEAQSAKPDRWTPSPNEPSSDGLGDGDGNGDALAGSLNDIRVNASIPDRMAAAHLVVPKSLAETDMFKKIDLATALQYGTAQGYPPLYSFLRQFVREHLHPNVPYKGGPEMILTVGSTDGFAKTLEMFVDPWSPAIHDVRDRPGLLCETFVYGSILSQSRPRGVQIVSVKADSGGMVATGPGSLEDVLVNWDYSKGRRPHLLYTVTMGHNPTGILLSSERRKELYAICSRFDVLIVEDDPYWYLQFPSAAAEEAKSRNIPPVADALTTQASYKPAKSSGYAFLDSLVPSFLAFDVDGRVVRLDTFSKTVAPGCRLGFITAQPELIERYTRVTEALTQQPSGFVQGIISELILGQQPAEVTTAWQRWTSSKKEQSVAFSGWEMDGWVRWIEGLRGEYERRMARMCRILDEGSVYVKQGTPRSASDTDVCVVTRTQLYDFQWPRGGMFVWIRIFLENHPLYGAPTSDGKDLIDGSTLSTGLLLFLTRKPFLVLASPGMMFSATEDVRTEVGWQHYRLCFAAESEENVDSCSKRFAKGVRKFWGIKNVEELEEIVRDAPAAAEDEPAEIGNLGMYMGC